MAQGMLKMTHESRVILVSVLEEVIMFTEYG